MEVLNEKNFMLFAAKYYDNANCVDILEFHDDLNRIKYLKRLFKKYNDTGEIKIQLVLNHLTVIYNVFYPTAATRMLVLKLKEHLSYLKPFLVYINHWPERINISNEIVRDSEISLDQKIVNLLREYDNGKSS
tara:strand:- start:224 stop:622 length:399 start_codon:yes stop_codon:yes gene_type:complete